MTNRFWADSNSSFVIREFVILTHFPTATSSVDEARKAILENGAASLCHDPLVIRQVVHRKKHGAQHFTGLKQMTQITPAVPTSRTGARRIERLAVHRVALIAQPQLPGIR